MKKAFTTICSGFQYFPILRLWFRLPGLILWAAVSFGIVTAALIPSFWEKLATIQQFYSIKIISSIISLFLVTVFTSRTIRFLTFFVLALILCTIRQTEQQSISTLLQRNQEDQKKDFICGKVISYPAPTRFGFRFLLKCENASFDADGLMKGRIIQCISTVSPVTTNSVKVFGQCTAPSKPKRPHEFDEARYLLAMSVWAKMEVDSVHILSPATTISNIAGIFRERVLTVLDRLTDRAHSGILQAAFLGESEYIPYEIKESFRKSGIYHLLSISGLHASMLMAATYFFLIIIPVNKNTKHIIALFVLWTYQLFIGFIPCLFRATIMATIIICSLLFQKKNYSMQSIGISGTLWLLHSPESLFLPGFQLSFCATVGIITLTPVLNRLSPKLSSPAVNFLLSRILSAFNISFSGFLSTLPVLIYHFGSISLFGLLANLLAVGTMSLCMWSFFVSLLFESIINSITAFSTFISAVTLDLLVWISKLADHVSWSSVSMDPLYPEATLFYVLFLIGCVTVEKKHLTTYLKWSLPILLIFFPIDFLMRTDSGQICIDRFVSKKCTALVICWPHNGVWILGNGNNDDLERLYSFSIRNWMRFKRGVFLEKIFTYNNHNLTDLTSNAEDIFECASANQHRFFSSVSKASYNCDTLFLYPTCNPKTSYVKITSGNNWIKCNFFDSPLIYNIQSNADSSVLSFPVSIKTEHK